MNATLYRPNQEPKSIIGHNFVLPNAEGYAEVTAEVAEALDCHQEAVDVLTTGPRYVVYSVFDSIAEINPTAMVALKELTNGMLNFEQEDEGLRGNILVVYASVNVKQP